MLSSITRHWREPHPISLAGRTLAKKRLIIRRCFFHVFTDLLITKIWVRFIWDEFRGINFDDIIRLISFNWLKNYLVKADNLQTNMAISIRESAKNLKVVEDGTVVRGVRSSPDNTPLVSSVLSRTAPVSIDQAWVYIAAVYIKTTATEQCRERERVHGEAATVLILC